MPAVRFYNAHDDILAAVFQYVGFVEHGIRFPDARRVAEKYL